MDANPLLQLKALGQSIWLDVLSRDLIASNSLAGLIAIDGISGVTTNPSICGKAIAEQDVYDEAISRLAASGCDTATICRRLIEHDVADAADLLRPEYERSGGKDGFVSIEVSPHLADDTEATVDEARRLWVTTNRSNVLIKVPATRAGVPAIRRLIAEGVNVNATLLFGVPRYAQVLEAYEAGLQDRLDAGYAVGKVASVASFFVSRIDTAVDRLLDAIIERGGANAAVASTQRGHAAIACARLAYRHFVQAVSSDSFRALAARGAHAQRLLWASTGTKDPAYADTCYVEPLIAADTINTMPLPTLDAYRSH